jgi:hypothetical protein
MKAQELRRNNIVLYNGEPVRITTISRVWIQHVTKWGATSNRAKVGDYSPLPITPALLAENGFTKNGFGEYIISVSKFEGKELKELVFDSSGDYLFLRHSNDLIIRMNNHDLITLWNKDIDKEFYMHKLQNLYFELTGKEL